MCVAIPNLDYTLGYVEEHISLALIFPIVALAGNSVVQAVKFPSRFYLTISVQICAGEKFVLAESSSSRCFAKLPSR